MSGAERDEETTGIYISFFIYLIYRRLQELTTARIKQDRCCRATRQQNSNSVIQTVKYSSGNLHLAKRPLTAGQMQISFATASRFWTKPLKLLAPELLRPVNATPVTA